MQQPWAYAIVDGAKRLEVRSWETRHRGPLLICASARPNNVFWRTGVGQDLLLPAGCMIGVVDLRNCRPMVKADAEAAMCDYLPKHFVWELESTGFVVPKSIAMKLNLFEIPQTDVQFLAGDEWLFDYEPPQGTIPHSPSCLLFG